MLNDYQWVTPRVALGSAISEPEHVRALLADGVSHVLDCRNERSAGSLYAGAGITYRQHGVADDGKPKPDTWFLDGIGFVLDALRSPWGKALVHCRFGMSRSPSMVYAILLALDVPPDEAVRQITRARAVARVTYRDDAERAHRRWQRRSLSG